MTDDELDADLVPGQYPQASRNRLPFRYMTAFNIIAESGPEDCCLTIGLHEATLIWRRNGSEELHVRLTGAQDGELELDGSTLKVNVPASQIHFHFPGHSPIDYWGVADPDPEVPQPDSLKTTIDLKHPVHRSIRNLLLFLV